MSAPERITLCRKDRGGEMSVKGFFTYLGQTQHEYVRADIHEATVDRLHETQDRLATARREARAEALEEAAVEVRGFADDLRRGWAGPRGVEYLAIANALGQARSLIRALRSKPEGGA